MLDVALGRPGPTPRDAATLILVRDRGRLEVFVVKRHQKSGFLGGALVFPGGKVDEKDREDAWSAATTPARPASFARDEDEARALAIAAAREALEEAAILAVSPGALDHAAALALQLRAKATPLLACLTELGLRLDLSTLHPFARWVTPEAESRRFDTRFFIAEAPPGQHGAHDDRETTEGFWASPRDILARFEAGDVQLAPPTHRTLELLAGVASARAAVELAAGACLDPICPVLVRHDETLALALPGDPEHPVAEPRVPGLPRYVLTGDRWLPAPSPGAPRTG